MPDAPDWLKTYGQSGLWDSELLTATESGFVFGELAAAVAGQVNVLTFWSASARIDGAASNFYIHSQVAVDLTFVSIGALATITLSPDQPSDWQAFPPGQLAWPAGEVIGVRAICAPGGGKVALRVYGLFYLRDA